MVVTDLGIDAGEVVTPLAEIHRLYEPTRQGAGMSYVGIPLGKGFDLLTLASHGWSAPGTVVRKASSESRC